MGLGQTANFEFHLSNWVSKDTAGTPILPEFAQPSGVPVVCLYGEDESSSLCPQLASGTVQVLKVQGGHHFGGDYEQLATLLLGYARLP
jgi:type IV secretory pathway VirJ component